MQSAILLLLAALIYVIMPWDFDFVPFFGRIDDAALLVLAIAYYRRMRRKVREQGRGREEARSRRRESPGQRQQDPYTVLGVSRKDDDAAIKKAYRELLGKYHPDRVQHLGEEFRKMAAGRTSAINGAYEQIKAERNFT